MFQLRRAEDRGHFDHGWLDTFHTFSFADYYDPTFMGFRNLRVINEDRVEGGQGFDTHGHRDMEILTYVYEGALQHRDSMGNGSIIPAGDIQYMSAGSGVTHSEYNAKPDQPVRLLQIWILPNEKGATPRYAQQTIAPIRKENQFCLLASPDGAEGSIAIRQDVRLSAATLGEGQALQAELLPKRGAWVQLIKGAIRLNDIELRAGDGVGVHNETLLKFKGLASQSEFLFFDLN